MPVKKSQPLPRSSQKIASSMPQAASNEGETCDYSKFSINEIIASIIERNTDPVIERMALALQAKIPQVISDGIEENRRQRSIIMAGIAEAPSELSPSSKQSDLEDKVTRVLDTLQVECRPESVFRLGSYSEDKIRLVKVVLPSRFHWQQAIANTRRLRLSGYTNVFVRKSMTRNEREQDYRLRQRARELNEGKSSKEWVVYRGELRRVSELAARRSVGNH